ncbi:luciferase family protein [Pedobacter agri]|uniref:luciferase domain-containing protein n=1 Tax=Pedobacter agri TaxID=454586 RepID=UPI00292E2B07|nr:luciferase family protein [Pedobacter agri]
MISNPHMLSWCDDIENEVLKWEGTSISLHKFGGTQFNFYNKELGHLHSNGILDIRLNQKLKKILTDKKLAHDHHIFEQSGWISFYIHNKADVVSAISLLRLAYGKMQEIYFKSQIVQ